MSNHVLDPFRVLYRVVRWMGEVMASASRPYASEPPLPDPGKPLQAPALDGWRDWEAQEYMTFDEWQRRYAKPPKGSV